MREILSSGVDVSLLTGLKVWEKQAVFVFKRTLRSMPNCGIDLAQARFLSRQKVVKPFEDEYGLSAFRPGVFTR
jgi:hypothetical protein